MPLDHQGAWDNRHLSRKAVHMFDHPRRKEILPEVQPKPPQAFFGYLNMKALERAITLLKRSK